MTIPPPPPPPPPPPSSFLPSFLPSLPPPIHSSHLGCKLRLGSRTHPAHDGWMDGPSLFSLPSHHDPVKQDRGQLPPPPRPRPRGPHLRLALFCRPLSSVAQCGPPSEKYYVLQDDGGAHTADAFSPFLLSKKAPPPFPTNFPRPYPPILSSPSSFSICGGPLTPSLAPSPPPRPIFSLRMGKS